MTVFNEEQVQEIRRIAADVCAILIKGVNARVVSVDADDLTPAALDRMVEEVARDIFNKTVRS